MTSRKRLGDILVEAGFLSQDQIQEALEDQKRSGEKLGDILMTVSSFCRISQSLIFLLV